MDEREFKEIEELLKKQKIKDVPERVLSDFTREVVERIESRRERARFRVLPVLACVAAGAAIAWFFLAARPAHQERPVQPRPVQVQIPVQHAPPMPALPTMMVVAQANELTIEEEMRLLEELADDSFTEGVRSDEEMILEEIEVLDASRG